LLERERLLASEPGLAMVQQGKELADLLALTRQQIHQVAEVSMLKDATHFICPT
jgi:hypothetical protein